MKGMKEEEEAPRKQKGRKREQQIEQIRARVNALIALALMASCRSRLTIRHVYHPSGMANRIWRWRL